MTTALILKILVVFFIAFGIQGGVLFAMVELNHPGSIDYKQTKFILFFLILALIGIFLIMFGVV